MAQLGAGHGFAELTAVARGHSDMAEAMLRGEVGFKPAENVSLFGFGEAGVAGRFGAPVEPVWQAGVGARVTF